MAIAQTLRTAAELSTADLIWSVEQILTMPTREHPELRDSDVIEEFFLRWSTNAIPSEPFAVFTPEHQLRGRFPSLRAAEFAALSGDSIEVIA